jgi:hypothetical protein
MAKNGFLALKKPRVFSLQGNILQFSGERVFEHELACESD